MSRMICFGAQSVAETELTAPRPRVEMQCRRDGADDQHRTYITAHPMDDSQALSALQLSLFEEPVSNEH